MYITTNLVNLGLYGITLHCDHVESQLSTLLIQTTFGICAYEICTHGCGNKFYHVVSAGLLAVPDWLGV